MHQQRMPRWTAIGFGLTSVLAGCGSSATGTGESAGASRAPNAPATTGATSAPEASAPPAASSSPANPAAGPLNTAVVTIGGERFEFSDVKCSIFAPRYIQAGNYGADPEVVIVLPPEGWESQGDTFSPPSVAVKIGDEFAGGKQWLAGDDGTPALKPVPAGSSRIDSYTVPDGRPVTATGTATFIDIAAHNQGGAAPSVSGTFEVSCP